MSEQNQNNQEQGPIWVYQNELPPLTFWWAFSAIASIALALLAWVLVIGLPIFFIALFLMRMHGGY